MFKHIQGQPQAVEYLRRAWQHQRLAHAFLFTGPEGVGKRTTARALAQAMNCQSPVDLDACGTCVACRKIEAAVHPDVHWISPEGQSIKIEQIRETLQREAMLMSLEGKTKLYVIDPADALTPEAANSLLKLLEEPPANVVIILVTSQPFSLLETIRSRCQEIRFHPLDKKSLTNWLVQRLACSTGEAMTLAMLAAGRPAEALRMVDPDKKALRDQVLSIVQKAGSKHWTVPAKLLGEFRSELPEIFMLILTWYRDMLVLANCGDQDLIVNLDQWDKLQAARKGETTESLQNKCYSVMRAREQLSRNVNVQLLLENLFLRLGNPGQVI